MSDLQRNTARLRESMRTRAINEIGLNILTPNWWNAASALNDQEPWTFPMASSVFQRAFSSVAYLATDPVEEGRFQDEDGITKVLAYMPSSPAILLTIALSDSESLRDMMSAEDNPGYPPELRVFIARIKMLNMVTHFDTLFSSDNLKNVKQILYSYAKD